MPDHPNIVLYVCDTEAGVHDRIGFIGPGYDFEIKSVQDDIAYDARTKSDGVIDAPGGKWLLVAKKRP